MKGEHRSGAIFREAGYLPVKAVIQAEGKLHGGEYLCRDRGIQRLLGGRRVGAHQAARAELGAAEVAHHRDQRISERGGAEQVQHGETGGLCRFAVVRGFFNGRVSVEYIGIADMACVIVLFSEGGQYLCDLFLAPYAKTLRQKAGFLFLKFALRAL